MKKIILLLNIFLIYNGYCQQPIINEELKKLIQYGFTYYPDLKEMEMQVNISEQRVRLTETYRMPTVSANVNYSYINPVGQVNFPIGPDRYANLKFQPNHNFNGYLGANYNLLDFGRVKANIERSKEELTQSKHGVELAQLNLASQISNIYYGIVFLKKNIAIQDSILNYLQENRKVTESKFRHGDALQVDLLNVQALIDNENNQKLDLQNSLQRNFDLLRYAVGKDTVTNAENFDFVYNNADLENLMDEASRQNPQFLLAKDQVRIAEKDIFLSRVQRMPSISLMATTGYRNGYQPNIYQLRYNYLLGAGLSVPIYSGGRLNMQTAVSSNLLRLNQLKVNTLENNYRRDIRLALDNIESFKARLANVGTQIEQAKAAQAVTASRYKNGTATYLDLTSASANYQRAHTTELQYKFQLCQSYIELSRLAGVKYW